MRRLKIDTVWLMIMIDMSLSDRVYDLIMFP